MEVPVLIAGGGGAGLAASMLLNRLGISSLLVSAQPRTSALPKAHVLNQHTMEIFRELEIDEIIYAAGTPQQAMTHTAWYAGLGRRLAIMEAFGQAGAS